MQKTLRLRLLWLFSLFSFSDIQAYPENIRYGYNNCQTCHISPTGGGILNKYGRGAGESFMNTWGYEGMAQATYGLFNLPSWFDIGGDIRQVEYKVENEQFSIQRKFLMQKDLEVSMELLPGFRFVTSGGYYGQTQRWERRRYYALFENSGENFSRYIRVGRFYPAYGILLDDHTRISRRALGFDQGAETFNIETGLSSQMGTIYFSRVLGNRPSFSDNGYGGIRHVPNGNDGWTSRISYFSSKFTQYSLNLMDLKNGDSRRRVVGLSMMSGLTKRTYLMLQYDHGRDEPQLTQFQVFFSRFGYVLFQGFHIRTDLQYNRSILTDFRSYGIGFQWFPFAHWELSGYYDRVLQNGIPGSSWLMMIHYHI